MANEKSNSQGGQSFIPPTWLDVALIQRALHNGGDQSRDVVGLSVRSATAAGDNYASSLYRVKAELSDGEERNLLVKGPAPGAVTNEFIKSLNAFQREGLMLAEVVPKMEALLEDAAPGRFPPLAARCLLYGDAPVDFLVLEDLCPGGFRMADRKRGLGLKHSLLALRTLARFHAASHALFQREPEVADGLPSLWLALEGEFAQYVPKCTQAAADALRSWPGFEEYAVMLEKFKPVALKTALELFRPKEGVFQVICHTDFWVNNMMFRYKDGDVEDLRVVDLQGSTVLSPATDLHYFLNSSVSEDVSVRHTDLLLREYHFSLRETLELLGLQAPSFEALLEDMDTYGAHAIMTLMHTLPLVAAERAPDLEQAMSGDFSSMAYLFNTPSVKKWFQRAIPEYARKGWIPAPEEVTDP